MIKARKLKGFQDFLPATMRLRQEIIDVIRRQAQLAGFHAIDTPALEYSEVLLGVGGETDKQVYRFRDNGDRDVALRFDLTVPFARFMAENLAQLSLPFKRLQMGPVWRAEKPQKGRYREFWQCDLDIIGVNSQAADSEILLCLHSILSELPCGPFKMVVGHRGVLSALLEKTLGSLSPELQTQALIIIDKLAKIGPEQVTAQLAALPGSSATGAATLIALLTRKGSRGTELSAVRELLADNSEALAALAQVEATVALIAELSPHAHPSIELDLGIARGLGYYTGIVFETILCDRPEWGSICSGGRYNNLLARYVNQELPGVGGSIGLDRLVAAIAENTAQEPTPGVFIAIATPDAHDYGFFLAHHLRQQGITCNLALREQKLAHQFKYANRHAYPIVVTIGGEEVAKRTVNIKNMLQGTELKQLPWQDLVQKIAEMYHVIDNEHSRSTGE